jgi:hypothetical protein
MTYKEKPPLPRCSYPQHTAGEIDRGRPDEAMDHQYIVALALVFLEELFLKRIVPDEVREEEPE